MSKVFVITAICVIVAAITHKRPLYSCWLIVMLIPFGFFNLNIGPFIRFPIIAAPVFTLMVCYLFSHNFQRDRLKKIHYRYLILAAMYLLLSAFLSFCMSGMITSTPDYSILEDNSIQAMAFMSSSIISGIILYSILCMEISSVNDCLNLMLVLMLSACVHGVLFFALYFVNLPLPEFMKPISIVLSNEIGVVTRLSSLYEITKAFYAGYMGYTENFAEYLFIVTIFGVIAFRIRKDIIVKILSATTILVAFYFAYLSTIKFFPIAIGIYIMLTIYLSKGYRNKIAFLSAGVLLLGIMIFVLHQSEHTFFGERFHVLFTRFDYVHGSSLDNITTLLGERRGDLFTIFYDVVQAGGLFGLGPLIVNELNGSVMVFHNLYYALMTSFGLCGLIVYLCLFASIARDLYFAIRPARGAARILLESIFIMYVVMLLEQMKVSVFRTPCSIMLWWFLFAIMGSLPKLLSNRSTERRQVVVMPPIRVTGQIRPPTDFVAPGPIPNRFLR